jgi:hypothetical protein
MISQFFHCDPLLGIDLQTLPEDINAAFTDVLFDVGIYLEVAALDGLDDFVVAAALEGQLSMKHAIENDASGPDVDSAVDFVVLLIVEALRRHVGQTAGVEIFLREEGNGSSNAKVNNLYLLLLGVDQQDVFQFEIAVYEVVLVAVLHPLDYLSEEHLRCLFIESALLFHVFEEFSPLQELHDDGHFHVLEGEAVVHLHDILVVQRL